MKLWYGAVLKFWKVNKKHLIYFNSFNLYFLSFDHISYELMANINMLSPQKAFSDGSVGSLDRFWITMKLHDYKLRFAQFQKKWSGPSNEFTHIRQSNIPSFSWIEGDTICLCLAVYITALPYLIRMLVLPEHFYLVSPPQLASE